MNVLAWLLAAAVGSAAVDVPSDGEGALDGLIEPYDVVEVSSRTPGILGAVPVRRGDSVRKGEVLAKLKSGLEEVAVDLARAQLAFAKRRAERNAELFEKELLSAHEQDQMETEIEIAELELRQARERLKMRTIKSPIDGVVVDRALSPGEYVGEGPILTVAQIDPLKVEVIVPVERLGSIAVGTEAEVRPEAPVGGTYRAKVTIVDRVVDAASGTFGVRLELPNPDGRLPAGLKCRVMFGAKGKDRP